MVISLIHSNGFGINDAETLGLFVSVIGLFLMGAPVRNAAVRVQRREKKAYNSPIDPFDEFYLPFWLKIILFPMFIFSKEPLLRRTITYRLVNLTFTLVMLLISVFPLDIKVKAAVGFVYVYSIPILMIIFKQQYRGG